VRFSVWHLRIHPLVAIVSVGLPIGILIAFEFIMQRRHSTPTSLSWRHSPVAIWGDGGCGHRHG